MNEVLHGSCIDLLPNYPESSVDLCFADPPFNIGLKYDQYNDKRTTEQYLEFTNSWLTAVNRVLKPTGSVYVAIGDEYAAEVNVAMKKLGWVQRNWVVWYYTFGENQRKKFNRCHTHILYFTKSSTEWTWNGDDIKVPSARQLKYNDKRAKAGGKIPDDVWEIPNTESAELFPAQAESFALPDDVWKVSRLCGSFKERVKRADGSVHPCQMPESILERVIKASSNVGEVVLDPFGGTGTTVAVAKRLGRQWLTMDISDEYVAVIKGRLGLAMAVDAE